MIQQVKDLKPRKPAPDRDQGYDLPRVNDQILRGGGHPRSSRIVMNSHQKLLVSLAFLLVINEKLDSETMNISNRLVDLAKKVAFRAQRLTGRCRDTGK